MPESERKIKFGENPDVAQLSKHEAMQPILQESIHFPHPTKIFSYLAISNAWHDSALPMFHQEYIRETPCHGM